MLNFTPLVGLLGGSIIGLAAVTLLLGCGEIMGASSIVSAVLLNPQMTYESSSNKWKILFLTSFCLTAKIMGYAKNLEPFEIPLGTRSSSGIDIFVGFSRTVTNLSFVLAGFFTGFGTQLSNGCTSGHGICGMARLSPRSIVACCTFMATGFITASLLRNNDLFRNADIPMLVPNSLTEILGVMLVSSLVSLTIRLFREEVSSNNIVESDEGDTREIDPLLTRTTEGEERNELSNAEGRHGVNKKDTLKMAPFVLASGSLFAVGLNISQMIDNRKVLGFLDLRSLETWDPTLAFVMFSGVVVSGIGYQYVEGFQFFKAPVVRQKPPKRLSMSGNNFQVPKNATWTSSRSLTCDETEVASPLMNTKLMVGASLFGFGWGIGGLCPGPATYLATVGYPQILYLYMPLYAIGAHAAQMECTQSFLG
jgi:uncharacterized membrane protein YedE/YeeE